MAIHKQQKFHRPCGHWHVRLFEDTPGSYSRNCWMPSLAVNGTKVFFVAAGKHMQLYSNTGCEIYMFEYDIGSNIWTLLYTELNIQAANKPGGTGYDDDICMFANYKADAEGNRLTETYSNFCIGVWVYKPSTSTMQYNEFVAPEQYLQNKVGCHESGMAAFAYEDAGGDLIVKVSTDWGATWTTKKTVAALGARKDWSLFVDKSGYIYLAHQITSANFMVEYSANNGTSWTTLETGEALITNMQRMKFVKEGGYYFIFGVNETQSTARYSNNGTNWYLISGYDDYYSIAAYASFLTTRAVNVVSGYMANYSYHADADAYQWTRREVPGYLPEDYDTGNWASDLLEFIGNEMISRDQADLNGYNGLFAYASYGFYSSPSINVSIAISTDEGLTWSVRQTPLRFFGSGSEITEFEGNPADWAERFTKQNDKYEKWLGLNL